MNSLTQMLAEKADSIYSWLFFGTLFGVLCWEMAAPLRALSASTATRWRGNGALFVINGALLWAVFPTVGVGAAAYAEAHGWGLLRQLELPFWLVCVVSVALLDLGHYIIHYAFHRAPLLWRVHRLHHTDTEFDFSTGTRFHPLEALPEHGANLIVTLLVGPPVPVAILFVLAYAFTTFWVHGNIRMPAGWDRTLRRVVITPEMHRTHHSTEAAETNSNYGGLLSCWDLLFGTYVDAPRLGHAQLRIGQDGFCAPRDIELVGMLMNPFLSAESAEQRAQPVPETTSRVIPLHRARERSERRRTIS